jgi:hypothetical protein
MAANATSLMETDYYNFPDWIEIINNGTTSVNLSEYYLSDDKDELKKWSFPLVSLNPNQYYLAYCDKEETGRHTNFGLSADGETIYLSNMSGNIIDQIKYGKQFPDISYGRNPSDLSKGFYCSTPTPGATNIISNATELSPNVKYSVEAGRLNSSVALDLTGNNIKYTINGAEPNSSSLSYSQPLSINHSMVVKTKNFQDGFLPSETNAPCRWYLFPILLNISMIIHMEYM